MKKTYYLLTWKYLMTVDETIYSGIILQRHTGIE